MKTSTGRRARMLAVACAVGVGVAGSALAATDYPIPGATQQASQLISNFEGFSSTPYNDAAKNGNCTIGYGTLLHKGPCTSADTAAYPNGVTPQQALSMLQNEANSAANTIDDHVTVPLTQQQRDALTSFVYNVGSGAFTNSTLLKDINAGNTQAAAAELLRWTHQNGKVVQGLVNRRNAERCYFLTGSTTCPAPSADELRASPLSFSPASATIASSGHAKLKLITHHPKAGKKLRYRGRHWAKGRVYIYAYVPGVSPYSSVHLPAKAGASGGFTANWYVSKSITDTLRWKLHGEQKHHSASTYATITGFGQ